MVLFARYQSKYLNWKIQLVPDDFNSHFDVELKPRSFFRLNLIFNQREIHEPVQWQNSQLDGAGNRLNHVSVNTNSGPLVMLQQKAEHHYGWPSDYLDFLMSSPLGTPNCFDRLLFSSKKTIFGNRQCSCMSTNYFTFFRWTFFIGEGKRPHFIGI